MGGFFGVAKPRHENCVNTLFYGVDYNSHMGTRRAGLVTVNNRYFARSIHNIENTYFRTKFESDLSQFSGPAGIGVISDTDAQPIIVNSHLGKFAIVTVAKVVNINELQQELLNAGHHFCEHSNDVVNPTELMATIICQGNTITEGIKLLHEKLKGSCSLLILCADGSIIAARDKLGRTPVIIGKGVDDNGYAVTSETCAFPNLGYKVLRDLGPGEIVRITSDDVEQLSAAEKEMQICAFLWTYYGYPPCEYEGRNVDLMRYADGVAVANADDIKADVVSPVPDSGTGMALGYANAKRIPYQRGMVKYTPTWPRSFTPSEQKRRELVAKMKLIPNGTILRDKSVVFCDDSIVRGTQLRDNVRDIREAGASQVHIRISCPPLVFPCQFLNFTASKTEMELIARRVIAKLENTETPDEDTLQLYCDSTTPQYANMVEEIRKELGLDSLRFATLDMLVNAIGLPKRKICTHCFDNSSHF